MVSKLVGVVGGECGIHSASRGMKMKSEVRMTQSHSSYPISFMSEDLECQGPETHIHKRGIQEKKKKIYMSCHPDHNDNAPNMLKGVRGGD